MNLLNITSDGLVLDFSKENLPKEYTIDDVLKTLNKEKRFANQIRWTVLQHSIVVGRILWKLYEDESLRLHGYTHELQESITRDVPSPIKRLIPNDAYNGIEFAIQEKLFKHFSIPMTIVPHRYEAFKEVDSLVAEVEMDLFLGWNSDKLKDAGYTENGICKYQKYVADFDEFYNMVRREMEIVEHQNQTTLIEEVKRAIKTYKGAIYK